MLKTKNMLMFVVLSAGMLTALSATMMSQAIPVFADKNKCEDNDNNNCNDTHKTQKIESKNKCETENENSHHSKKNDNENLLICDNIGANVKDVLVLLFQRGTDGAATDGATTTTPVSGTTDTVSVP
jgi:hypothetical protein